MESFTSSGRTSPLSDDDEDDDELPEPSSSSSSDDDDEDDDEPEPNFSSETFFISTLECILAFPLILLLMRDSTVMARKATRHRARTEKKI